MRRNFIHSSQKIVLTLFLCWHISFFFVYSDHHSRSFFYISTSSLSSSILSELDITRLLNSLILFISLHNLEISNTSRLTEYLFILSTTLIKNDASQKDLNHRKMNQKQQKTRTIDAFVEREDTSSKKSIFRSQTQYSMIIWCFELLSATWSKMREWKNTRLTSKLKIIRTEIMQKSRKSSRNAISRQKYNIT